MKKRTETIGAMMDSYKFQASGKQYLGEDYTLEVQLAEYTMPAVALTKHDAGFPLEVDQVAVNIQTLLNGHEPYALDSGDHKIFYCRDPGGFDLHYQPSGDGLTRKGLSVRVHGAALPQDLQSFLYQALVPGEAFGMDVPLAAQICRSCMALPTDAPATDAAKNVKKAPAVRPPDNR